MVAGVKYLLRMPQRREKSRDNPLAEWVNVFEKAVLDMTAEGLNVELKNMGGWHIFEKSNFDPRETGTCVGSS